MAKLALGLDSSTQSLTAVIVDIDERKVVYEKSLDYRADPRLNKFGLGADYILPPNQPGEANQPIAMYFESIDAIFADMKDELPDYGLNLADIAVINTSGQQHGHGLFKTDSQKFFNKLTTKNPNTKKNLVEILKGSLSLPFARIWRTSNTADLADNLRQAVGGTKRLIQISGSNAPLRFSAFGIMKTAQQHPTEYNDTLVIHQISSIVPAVLTANIKIPLDYGNACGTSLMNYIEKQWSKELIAAADSKLAQKLPPLASGKTLVGKIAIYFVTKYGLNPNCAIGIGSGDNPQLKVLVAGSLLSLGSSFVNMVKTDGKTFDTRGFTNAMYDAIDNPFMFGCRTNGALSWDATRALHNIEKKNYKPGEKALAETPPANNNRFFIWHPSNESFPIALALGPVRIGYQNPNFAADYTGIIESALASVYVNSKYFTADSDTIYVAGGATSSPQIIRRIAAIWNRSVVAIENGGSALGAAVSGACALLTTKDPTLDPATFCPSFLKKDKPIPPRPEDIAAYHSPNGFLQKFEKIETKLITKTTETFTQ